MSPCHPVPASSLGPENCQCQGQVPAGLEALCPTLCPACLCVLCFVALQTMVKNKALGSVWFCPFWPFTGDGAVVKDAVRVFFFSNRFQGLLWVGELVENSFLSCKEAGVEDEWEPS